jgi:hypothetical protein
MENCLKTKLLSKCSNDCLRCRTDFPKVTIKASNMFAIQQIAHCNNAYYLTKIKIISK